MVNGHEFKSLPLNITFFFPLKIGFSIGLAISDKLHYLNFDLNQIQAIKSGPMKLNAILDTGSTELQ